MWLEYFQALISGYSPIRMYHSQTSCWHTLNESHKILGRHGRHGIPFLLYNLVNNILSSLLPATQIQMMKLDVILHPIPNSFDWFKIRRVCRPENRLSKPLALPSKVFAAVWAEALSCITESQGLIETLPWIRGTILSQKFWELMDPNPSSQNKKGPFTGHAKQPQNIHPTLFFAFSPTQSALYS